MYLADSYVPSTPWRIIRSIAKLSVTSQGKDATLLWAGRLGEIDEGEAAVHAYGSNAHSTSISITPAAAVPYMMPFIARVSCLSAAMQD